MLKNTGQRFTVHLVKIKSKPEEAVVPETESTQSSSEPSESDTERSTVVSLNTIAAVITPLSNKVAVTYKMREVSCTYIYVPYWI